MEEFELYISVNSLEIFSKIAVLTFVHNINKGWDIACMAVRFATVLQDLLREHFLVPRCTVQSVQKEMLTKTELFTDLKDIMLRLLKFYLDG